MAHCLKINQKSFILPSISEATLQFMHATLNFWHKNSSDTDSVDLLAFKNVHQNHNGSCYMR